MDNLFDTKGVELPTRPGVSSQAVITVQGVVGGVPIAVAGGGGTVDQGLPAVVGNAWPIKVTDGVDTAAVAPGGTPAAVGDPALVVTISPNTAPITAADASVGATGAAVPGFTQQNGGTDGANLRANRMFDLDSGAGAEFNLGVTLRASAPGGSVEAGTTANPLEIAAASLPLPTGAATEATLLTRAAAAQLPAALVGGRLDTNTGAWLGSTAPTVGQKTMAASIPVTLASDQPAIPVSSTPSASTASAVTQVAGSLVVVTLKALNAARKGLTLYNEGNQAWYVKLGAAATLTSFTVKILRDGYYEVPFGYTGIVTGIQAVSSSSLYVTELT